jgi:hypothetical protein
VSSWEISANYQIAHNKIKTDYSQYVEFLNKKEREKKKRKKKEGEDRIRLLSSV